MSLKIPKTGHLPFLLKHLKKKKKKFFLYCKPERITQLRYAEKMGRKSTDGNGENTDMHGIHILA